MKLTTANWIEAGKILAVDTSKKVLCPECGAPHLKTKDITNNSNPNELERLMYCLVCGAKNYLLLNTTSTNSIREEGVGTDVSQIHTDQRGNSQVIQR